VSESALDALGVFNSTPAAAPPSGPRVDQHAQAGTAVPFVRRSRGAHGSTVEVPRACRTPASALVSSSARHFAGSLAQRGSLPETGQHDGTGPRFLARRRRVAGARPPQGGTAALHHRSHERGRYHRYRRATACPRNGEPASPKPFSRATDRQAVTAMDIAFGIAALLATAPITLHPVRRARPSRPSRRRTGRLRPRRRRQRATHNTPNTAGRRGPNGLQNGDRFHARAALPTGSPPAGPGLTRTPQLHSPSKESQ
jgi:hypothetical protein